MSIDVSLKGSSPSFKGNLVMVNKKGERTLIPTEQVKYIEENTSGLAKGVYITTHIDKSWGNNFYRIKDIPYQEVVNLYKSAKDSGNDVEINVE